MPKNISVESQLKINIFTRIAQRKLVLLSLSGCERIDLWLTKTSSLILYGESPNIKKGLFFPINIFFHIISVRGHITFNVFSQCFNNWSVARMCYRNILVASCLWSHLFCITHITCPMSLYFKWRILKFSSRKISEFVVKMYSGTEFDIMFARALVHCDNRPSRTGISPLNTQGLWMITHSFSRLNHINKKAPCFVTLDWIC